MKIVDLVKFLSLLLLIIIFQLFVPSISIGGFIIVPDILIIALTYIGFYFGRFEAILSGFLFGFIQDFATQLELIGTLSFIKSIMGYFLGSLSLYRSIWSVKFRLAMIFIFYFMHFFIFYFISLNGLISSKILFFNIILIHSALCFCILIFFDKSIMDNGILK